MSHTTALAAVAALDAFVIGGLACVCLIPFHLDVARILTLVPRFDLGLGVNQEAALAGE